MFPGVWAQVELVSDDGGRREPSTPPAPAFDFHAIDAAQSGLDFVHRSGATGADKRHMIECVGAGLGMLDVDDDGDLDIVCVQGGVVEPDGRWDAGEAGGHRIYRNDGTGRFTGTALPGLGFAFGVSAADVDGDEDEDLFIACLGPNLLLLNDGDGRFALSPGAGGLSGNVTDWTVSASFADADGDGDLDVYVVQYLAHELEHEMVASGKPCRWLGCPVPCGPKGLPRLADRFYLNDGAGHFTDVTDAAGMGGVAAYGFQSVWSDYDGDGRCDVFVANDSDANLLFRNLGPTADGLPRFEEIGLTAGVAFSDTGREQAGMGLAVDDVDGDGRFDILMTNFSQESNALFRNASDDQLGLMFFDESASTGLGWPSYTDLGWGVSFLDGDLDGDLDVFVANGHVYPHVDACEIASTTFEQRDRVFAQVSPGRFRVADGTAGPGLELSRSSRGCAAGDLDGDGDVDLAVSVLDGKVTLLENRSARTGSWVRLDLRPMAASVGARVEVVDGSSRQVREVRRGSSFLGVEDRALHFGLPAPEAAVTATVRWPDGSIERWSTLTPGRTHRLRRGEGER